MKKYVIVTLDDISFPSACKQLREIAESDGFQPDAIVAVPRGGCYVADAGWHDLPIYEVSLRRPADGNRAIKSFIGHTVARLPLRFRDWLRRMDARHLVKRTDHMADTTIIVPELPVTANRILVVDDAVDSGATLRAVISKLTATYPDKEIKTAVITVTAEAPVFMPDYYLYHNSTLVRMPWSIDAK